MYLPGGHFFRDAIWQCTTIHPLHHALPSPRPISRQDRTRLRGTSQNLSTKLWHIYSWQRMHWLMKACNHIYTFSQDYFTALLHVNWNCDNCGKENHPRQKKIGNKIGEGWCKKVNGILYTPAWLAPMHDQYFRPFWGVINGAQQSIKPLSKYRLTR